MNDYWHIPRASLTSSLASSAASSSASSNKSHSNPPTVAKRLPQTHNAAAAIASRTKILGNTSTTTAALARAAAMRRTSEISATNAAVTAAAAAAVLDAAKRNSRSSQSSASSNNSTRSAASGSLLLTAANLERFTEIHKKQQLQNKYLLDAIPSVHTTAQTTTTTTTMPYSTQQHISTVSGNHNDATISIDPNLDFIKTKDLDTVSIASSMHFTMVNGEGGPAKKTKRGLCDRGRQVPVLIISMSGVFLLLIMGMVYALEMRAREMPQS